tara:strand:- start:662 stop:1021 length:360 start_codon:yes stop_codon:yes gene_type:complete
MKALAITALVITGVSFVIPVFGVFISLFTSVLALISFRWEATLSGITVGINLVKTAFLSPSLVVAAAAVASDEITSGESIEAAGATGASLYYFYVGWHVVILVIGIILAMTKKKTVISE